MGFCIQQNCFLLPLSNKSLFLYRCVLNFDLTTVSLWLISPGKEFNSQLPSAKNATSDERIFPVGRGLWTDNLFLLDQPIIVQTSKLSCPSIWRRSNCTLVHDMWKWRGEKNRRSGCRSLEAPLAAASSCSYRGTGCCDPAFYIGTQHL